MEVVSKEYAAALVACLAQWDPQIHSDSEQAKASKASFVDALTEIAALPSDSMSMEVRRLLVINTSGESRRDHLDHLIEALESRDTLLKCKAANAIGSVCMSRVAGQQLLDLFGESILLQLKRMVSTKNEWAQGDACFVLGWMVVLADEKLLVEISKLVPNVLKSVDKSLHPKPQRDPPANERLFNIRIYSLVFLLNLCQRNSAQLLEESLAKLVATLQNLLESIFPRKAGLSSQADAQEDQKHDSTAVPRFLFESTESAELLQLWITLVSLLVDQGSGVAHLMAQRRMLPILVRLSTLFTQEEHQSLRFQAEEMTLLQQRTTILVQAVIEAARED